MLGNNTSSVLTKGLSVAGFTAKTLLISFQKGVEKSLLIHLKVVNPIIRVVHQIIRFTIFALNSAKDLEVLHSGVCRIIQYVWIGLSD